VGDLIVQKMDIVCFYIMEFETYNLVHIGFLFFGSRTFPILHIKCNAQQNSCIQLHFIVNASINRNTTRIAGVTVFEHYTCNRCV